MNEIHIQKLKQFVLVAIVLGLASVLTFGAVNFPAYAQPTQPGEGNGSPDQIELLNSTGEGPNRVLTSGSRNLGADERHVYRFDYDGGDQPITVWMRVTPANAAQFEIWPDVRYLALESEPNLEPLAVGAPSAEGPEFLNWQGNSPEPDTFYVVIEPTEGQASQYLLNISSLGLAAEQSGIVQTEPTPIPPTDTPTVVPDAPAEAPTQPPAEIPADPAPAVPEGEVATATPVVVTATPDPNVVPNVAVATEVPNVPTDVAVVTTAMLNVRTGPSTAYQVITAVPRGTRLTVLGRNEANTWIAVRLEDGREGWVTRSLTDYQAIAVVVLTPDPLPTPTLIPGLTQVPPTSGDPTVVVIETQEPRALDGSWQLLREGETHWYTFQYRGGQLPVHVWMDVEPHQGAVFNILDRQTALAVLAGVAPNVVNAIGRGTSNPVEPGYLFWRADFPEADVLYVMVQHTGPGNVYYSIHAAGPGLGRPVPE